VLAERDPEHRPFTSPKATRPRRSRASIKGDQTVDYTLRAKAGQNMSATLKTGNGANYFNVLPPGSDGRGHLRWFERRQRMDRHPAGRR
jgi:hypothetical protein